MLLTEKKIKTKKEKRSNKFSPSLATHRPQNASLISL
jgi:hypothetical protein